MIENREKVNNENLLEKGVAQTFLSVTENEI